METTPGQAEQDDPGAIDTKEPRNDCTPTIRGHQIWRLSIPAEFTPSVSVPFPWLRSPCPCCARQWLAVAALRVTDSG